MHAHSLMRSPSVPALYYPSSFSVLLHFLHIWCGFHCVFRAFLISKTCMQYFRSAYPCIFYHAPAHSIPFTPLPFRRGFCMFCWWYVSLYFSVYSIKFFTPWVPGRIPYWGGVSGCVRCAIHDSVDFPKDRGESFSHTSHAFLLSWGNSCASSSRLHSIFPMYLFPRFFPLGVNHLLSLGLSLMQHCPSDYVPSTFRVHSPFLPLLVYSSVPQWVPHEFTIRKPCVPAQVPS